MALETEKSEIKVLADLVPNERLPLPTLCPHTERMGGGLWPLPLLGRMLIPLWGFALRTSSNIMTSQRPHLQKPTHRGLPHRNLVGKDVSIQIITSLNE